jgi:fido (protein-threonine AMPylation protein)/predicted transcriptional regulator
MSYNPIMMDPREQKILDFIREQRVCSSREIHDQADVSVSYATLKRMLTKLIYENYLSTVGQGKGTKYTIAPTYELLVPVDMDVYYEKEIDERVIKQGFNFTIIHGVLARHSVFTANELERLNALHAIFQQNISQLSEAEYRREFERLAIDLSWKSSQIEGNTYSLLETERLLKERETAAGKTKEEAIMLLNHKEALDFILENPDYIHPLTVSKIEDIHSLLTKELFVERNLRKRRVGISGTNYRPLDNEFQISEALGNTCDVINNKDNVFEKALLALVMISYIQPFMDGNKRTARIVSNAILMHEKHCPLSFRTVDAIHYKKAMLLFYEQNNISNFKEIFMDQFDFAVNTYF